MTTIDAITVETLLTHSNFVRGLARALVSDPATADDAVQQAWLEACERPPRDLRSPKGWLATVTRQAAAKIRRSETRRQTREETVAKAERVPSAAEIAEREEARRRLMEAVFELDTPYRDAIVLRYLEELPPREVAARLGVPVETARTRIKRGLRELRGALDSAWDGDRRGWGMALLTLALPAATTAAPKLTVAAASVLVVAGFGLAWSLGLLSGPEQPPSSGVANNRAAALPATGAAASLVPESDQGGSSTEQERVERVEPPKPVAAAGVLRLEAKLERGVVIPGEAVVMSVTFENAGQGKLDFFVPEHFHLVPFPRWRLIAANGDTYVPETPSFQSSWTIGIQGTIQKLDPGKTWSSKARARRFYKIDPKADTNRRYYDENPVRLPVGGYRVECVYEQKNEEVPFGKPGFARAKQQVEGLWTGTVAAAPIVLQVADPLAPSLMAKVPDKPVAGGPVRVELRVRNPLRSKLVLKDLRVSIHSKGYGDGVALVPASAIELPNGSAGELAVPGDGVLRAVVDFSVLQFTRTNRGKKIGPFGFFELQSQGMIHCSTGWQVAGEDKPLFSDPFWIMVAPRPVAAIDGLELTVQRAGGAQVHVKLTNIGTEPIRVRKRLSWPIDVRLEVTDADKKRKSSRSVTSRGTAGPLLPPNAAIVRGLSWNGNSYESAGPLTAGDFEVLPPSGVVSRVLDLSKMVYDGLPKGRYEVRAIWKSLTSGVHLGLPPAVVGALEARPIVIEHAGN